MSWLQASADSHALLLNEVWRRTGGVEVKGKGLMDTFVWTPPAPFSGWSYIPTLRLRKCHDSSHATRAAQPASRTHKFDSPSNEHVHGCQLQEECISERASELVVMNAASSLTAFAGASRSPWRQSSHAAMSRSSFDHAAVHKSKKAAADQCTINYDLNRKFDKRQASGAALHQGGTRRSCEL